MPTVAVASIAVHPRAGGVGDGAPASGSDLWHTDGDSSRNIGDGASTSGRYGTQQSAASKVRGARVEVRDMAKHFATKKGLFTAVDGVSVEMAPGTITALLGPSGSGGCCGAKAGWHATCAG